MLIVEGPDGAGKTRLVTRLCMELGWPINEKIVAADTSSSVSDMRFWVEQNLREGLVPRIFDRHAIISEYIYAPFMRDSPRDGMDDLHWAGNQWEHFRSINPYVVMCLPDLEIVQRNIDDDIFNRKIAKHIRGIYWAYMGFTAQNFELVNAVWDYTKTGIWERLLNDIQMWRQQRGL